MMAILGVDGGASKTFALVADEQGRVLGFGRAGPGNHQTVGIKAAIANIERAGRAALDEATISPPVALAFLGLAGADLPVDFARLTPAVDALGLAEHILIKNDTLVALRAGLKRRWGVAVVCGTGFNAGGIAPDGTEFQLPGLGALSGDWGGGGDLAREAIRLVCRAWDGRGRPTALTKLVLTSFDVPSVDALIAHLYEHKSNLGQHLFDLVPLIFDAAYDGDVVAQDLLARLGTEVGVTANAIIRRLDLAATPVEVVLGGGVFKGRGPLLIDAVVQEIHRVAPQATVARPEFEPVVGAVLLAREHLGLETDKGVYTALRTTLRANPGARTAELAPGKDLPHGWNPI